MTVGVAAAAMEIEDDGARLAGAGGHVHERRARESAVRDREREVGGGRGPCDRRRQGHQGGDQPRGLTHVSDQARHALDDGRSPRISAHT